MDKQSRDRVFEQLKVDEGVKYEIYLDTEGLPTVGIGHLILPTDLEYQRPLGSPITENRAYELFNDDLDVSISECKVLYGAHFDIFPTEVKEILVNMMFNMGRPRLTKFKNFNAALKEQEWDNAADEMIDSRWYRQVKGRAERLVERMRNV